MKVKIEAVQNVTTKQDITTAFEREVTTQQVVAEQDFTEQFQKARDEALATLKAKYPKDTSFRLHICQNDEQKPCALEDL